MSSNDCKYKTYEELAEAFKSGELSDREWMLQMDNDNCFLVFIGETVNEQEADDRHAEAQSMFRGGGQCDAVELAQAAGIPCEWC